MPDATLQKVVHAKNDALWDVAALLDSKVKAIDAQAKVDPSYLSRTMRMAHDKVRAVQDEFQAFI